MRTLLCCAVLLLSTIEGSGISTPCEPAHADTQEYESTNNNATKEQAKICALIGPLTDSVTTCILSHSDIDPYVRSVVCALKSAYIHNTLQKATQHHADTKNMHLMTTFVSKVLELFYISSIYHQIYYSHQEQLVRSYKISHMQTCEYENRNDCHFIQHCEQVLKEYDNKRNELDNNSMDNLILSLFSVIGCIFGNNVPV